MAALGCDVGTLLSLSGCLMCLSDYELLAAEVMLREQKLSASPRPLDQLLIAGEVWTRLSDHQRQAIEVRLLCNDAVDLGKRTSCTADAITNDIKCYCEGDAGDLKALVNFLKCAAR